MQSRTALFFKKVTKSERGCWIWNGALSGSGYGQFWIGGRSIPAHWFLLPQYPPRGHDACHKCDNKLCVNPDHIFIGSRSENMRDCVAKGRLRPQNGAIAAHAKCRPYSKGQEHHNAKLNESQVKEILASGQGRGELGALAAKFGVAPSLISMIRKKKAWIHLQ